MAALLHIQLRRLGDISMSIKFFIPKNETIPSKLRLYADGIRVEYVQSDDGFIFYINTKDENKAIEIVNRIAIIMKIEHKLWKTKEINIVKRTPKEIVIEWKVER